MVFVGVLLRPDVWARMPLGLAAHRVPGCGRCLCRGRRGPQPDHGHRRVGCSPCFRTGGHCVDVDPVACL